MVMPRIAGDSRVGSVAILPNQLAGLGVQGLQHHAGVVHIKHAVVHDRRGLIAQDDAVLHGPTPHQPQVVDVLRGDLIQRAEGVGLVIAPDHEPVGRIRIAQHGVGHRHIVLHFARDRDSARRLRFLFRLLGLFRLSRWTVACLQIRRSLTRRDAANGHRRRGRERLIARPCAIGIQNERCEVQIRIAGKSGSARRHRGLHEVDQFAGRPVTPLGQKVGARQLRPFPPAEIGRMAGGAVGLVDRASGRGLVLRIWSGRTLLRQQKLREQNRRAAGRRRHRENHSNLHSASNVSR